MARESNPSIPATYDQAFYLGFGAMVVLVPLVYLSETVFVAYFPKLFLLQAALLYLIIVWQLKQRVTGFSGLQASPFTLPILLYLAVSALSTFQAINRVEALVQLSHQIALTLLFLVLLNNLRRQDILRYLRPLVGTGALVSWIGIVQYAGWGLFWIPSTGMPSATLGYRNFAAMYMILCIPLGFLLFLETRRPTGMWAWGMTVASNLTFLIGTRTRGAWVGLLAACVIALLAIAILRFVDRFPDLKAQDPARSRARIPVLFTGAVFTVVFILLIPPDMGDTGYERHSLEKAELTQSFTSLMEKGGDKHRLDLWKNTWTLIEDHLLLGVGIGNWQFVYPAYDRGDVVYSGAAPRRPHNDYLWIASELGLPGLLIFLWILVLALFRCLGLAVAAKNRTDLWTAVCLGIAMLAIMAHAFFSFPRERVTPSMVFWITVACVAVLDAGRRPERLYSHSGWKTAQTTACVLLALCLWMTARAIAFDQRHARALDYANLNQWHGVIRETAAAIPFGAFDPQVFLVRGAAFLTRGDYGRAAENSLRCLAYHPNLVNALNNLGMAYNGQKKYEEALKILKRLLKIDPDHIEAHTNLGMAYQGLGRLDEAVAEYEQALARKSHRIKFRAATRYRLGTIYQKQQRLDRAADEFRRALSIDSTYLPTHFSLGEIHALQGDTARAIASYETFLNNTSDSFCNSGGSNFISH